jgi:uracil-DNA glycosylase family 4
MKHCNLCNQASNFQIGLKGKNTDITKLLFVLHRPDKRITETFLNYEAVLRTTKTGYEIDLLLEYCGLNWKDVFITNFFKCTLPKDKNPKKQEYENCLQIFSQQVRDFKPKKIIVFGNQPYKHLFPEQSKQTKIKKAYNQDLMYQSTPTLILPHPSRLWALNPQSDRFISDKQMPYFNRAKQFLNS